MAEKAALIIAHEENQWENVELLTETLVAARYEIVADGATAEFIESKKLPTTNYEDFLGEVYVEHEAIERLSSEKARKRRVAGYLAESLGQEREDLEAADWPVLDLAYINLASPVWVEYEDDKKDYLEHDETGKMMINATINRPRKDRRPTIVAPDQIPSIVEALRSGADPLVSKEKLAAIRRQALVALSLQNNLAAAHLRYVPTEFPPATPPNSGS